MKGKLYNPSFETPNFKSLERTRSNHSYKNFSVTSFECIWPSSIPESWQRIMNKKNISNVRINKTNRNTLDFLQETQKYISHICKPAESDQITIAPKKFNDAEYYSLRKSPEVEHNSRKKYSDTKYFDQKKSLHVHEFFIKKKSSLKGTFMKKRRVMLRDYNVIRNKNQSPNHFLTPLSRSFIKSKSAAAIKSYNIN
jgi:hypothetical protein